MTPDPAPAAVPDVRAPPGRPRPSAAARRFGYLLTMAIDGILLYLIHVSPGWEEISFLTPDVAEVLGPLTALLVTVITVNGLLVLRDPPRLRALGDVVLMGFTIAVTARVLQVFPFTFAGWSRDWSTGLRILLVVGLIGSVIGVIEAMVRLVTGSGGVRGP